MSQIAAYSIQACPAILQNPIELIILDLKSRLGADIAITIILEYLGAVVEQYTRVDFEKTRKDELHSEISKGIPLVLQILKHSFDYTNPKSADYWKMVYQCASSWISFGIPNMYANRASVSSRCNL